MAFNDVVVKYKDGRIKKGSTENWSPSNPRFYIHLIEEGGTEMIHLEHLKAVYFVKDFHGDKNRKESYDENRPGEGIKVAVEFSDGETLFGYCLSYSPKRDGFMLTPADTHSNNIKIFIIQSATNKVVCELRE